MLIDTAIASIDTNYEGTIQYKIIMIFIVRLVMDELTSGSCSIKEWIFDAFAAFSISSCDAALLLSPKAIFSAMLRLKSTGSWNSHLGSKPLDVNASDINHLEARVKIKIVCNLYYLFIL